MKICLKCKIEHEDSNFRKKSASKDGLAPWCTPCLKTYESSKKELYKNTRDTYRSENKDKEYAQKRIYRESNRDSIREKDKEYRTLNRDKAYQRKVNWVKNNPDKARAQWAKRRAFKLQAIPKWADLELITLTYKQCKDIEDSTGVPHHVDHIVPLISDRVCGLHCESNLQILTAQANLIKSNSYWPDM